MNAKELKERAELAEANSVGISNDVIEDVASLGSTVGSICTLSSCIVGLASDVLYVGASLREGLDNLNETLTAIRGGMR